MLVLKLLLLFSVFNPFGVSCSLILCFVTLIISVLVVLLIMLLCFDIVVVCS